MRAEIKNRQLIINNVPQKTHVFPPTVCEIFNIDENTQLRMDKMELFESTVIKDKQSSFKGHAFSVKSVMDVRMAYRKIKQMYPEADHAMMAYTKKGVHVGHHHDGEYGAGAKLLQLLLDRGANNMMVLVIHIFGGIKLGPRRFIHIERAARDALNEMDSK